MKRVSYVNLVSKRYRMFRDAVSTGDSVSPPRSARPRSNSLTVFELHRADNTLPSTADLGGKTGTLSRAGAFNSRYYCIDSLSKRHRNGDVDLNFTRDIPSQQGSDIKKKIIFVGAFVCDVS